MNTVRVLIRRRPVLAFVVVAVPISWAVLLLPELAGPDLVPLPARVLAATWLVLLPSALLITRIADGPGAVRRLLSAAPRWPSGSAGRTAAVLSLAVPGATALLAVVLGVVLGGTVQVPTGSAVAEELLALGSAVLLIHLAEETVWAGFVQHRLAQQHGPVVAAGLTAAPFAAVHLPLLLPIVDTGRLLTGVAGLAVLAVVVRLLVATVATNSRCVLAAAVLHGCFNAGTNEGRLLDLLSDRVDIDLLGTAVAVVGAAGVLGLRRRSGPTARRHEPGPVAPRVPL